MEKVLLEAFAVNKFDEQCFYEHIMCGIDDAGS
jgi:hypothetical protein